SPGDLGTCFQRGHTRIRALQEKTYISPERRRFYLRSARIFHLMPANTHGFHPPGVRLRRSNARRPPSAARRLRRRAGHRKGKPGGTLRTAPAARTPRNPSRGRIAISITPHESARLSKSRAPAEGRA